MIVDFKNAPVRRNDPANQAMMNRVASKTIQLGLFVTDKNAFWAADKYLNIEAYPLATFAFPANRKMFRLEAGDPFLFTYPKYDIENMVCRVLRVEEESPLSEKITVTAVEDIYQVGIYPDMGTHMVDGTQRREETLSPLTDILLIEAPYILAGNEIILLTSMSRIAGIEQGYVLYMSLDGTSYEQIAVARTWGVHGTLVSQYPPDSAYRIDDYIGFQVDVDSRSSDGSVMESISRASLISGSNLCLLGNEIIGVQTVTPDPVIGDRYAFAGIYRGRFDTEPQTHSPGEDFWWINWGGSGQVINPAFLTGVTRYFKFNPFSGSASGDLSQANEETIAIQGRAKTPYTPCEPTANDEGFYPKYATGGDVVLDWHPRIRGEGAGIGDADTVTDAAPTWEGLFRVQVYVSDILMRTAPGIDDDTWTYTNAMIVSDNGGEPDEIEFRVSNYRTEGGITYYSSPAIVTCYKV